MLVASAATMSAASVTTAALKPATTTVKAAATAMEATAAAVKATSTVEAAAMEATTMKVTTAAAVIKATATVEAPIKEAISVPEAKATPETKPGTCTDENAALKPVRAVIAVGRAGVWVIVVIAIAANRRRSVIDGPSKSNAEGDALGVRIRGREETNTEKKTE